MLQRKQENMMARQDRSLSDMGSSTWMPWPHQKEALEQLEQAAVTSDRMTLVMACGSGKTVLALRFAERLGCRRVLILLPSLGLLAQTLQEWLRLMQWQNPRYLCVCSDASVERAVDAFSPDLGQLGFAVTTDANTVREFMSLESGEVQLVFSTYQSAPVVAAGMTPEDTFDLAVFDEAHKTAGLADHLFSFALSDERLRCQKRLFMTATPKQYVLRDQQDLQLVCSMDSPELYGHLCYHLPFAEAVERDIICDYQVIIPVITSQRVHAWTLHDSKSVLGGKTVAAETLAHYIALQDAVKKQGIQKIVTFHSRVQHAKDFRGAGKKIGAEFLPGFQFFHINGKMPAERRELILQRFAKAPTAVLTNARCLTEGIDIPNVDLVAFLSPKHSRTDIVQAAGRAMRKAPGKERGYVLVPLYVELAQQESIEEAVLRLDYSDIWETLYALADHDALLANAIRVFSQKQGETGEMDTSVLKDKILIETPLVNAQLLQQSILTLCLEKLYDNWDKRYGELLAYKERYGHANVPVGWKENKALAYWVFNQIQNYKSQLLSKERIEKLNAIHFTWNRLEAAWQKKYQALQNYYFQYGHCHISKLSSKSRYSPLYNWVLKQRKLYRENKLLAEKINLLNNLNFSWGAERKPSLYTSEENWEKQYQAFILYKNKQRNESLPKKHSLFKWVSVQRAQYSQGKLDPDKIERLNRLGFKWEMMQCSPWENRYIDLINYKKKWGSCHPKIEKDPGLYKWVIKQRNRYQKNLLNKERAEKLHALGVEWDCKQANWERCFNKLKQYYKGSILSLNILKEDASLYGWAKHQRKRYKQGKLEEEKIKKLKAIFKLESS